MLVMRGLTVRPKWLPYAYGKTFYREYFNISMGQAFYPRPLGEFKA
jgi:hypothetical protein